MTTSLDTSEGQARDKRLTLRDVLDAVSGLGCITRGQCGGRLLNALLSCSTCSDQCSGQIHFAYDSARQGVAEPVQRLACLRGQTDRCRHSARNRDQFDRRAVDTAGMVGDERIQRSESLNRLIRCKAVIDVVHRGVARPAERPSEPPMGVAVIVSEIIGATADETCIARHLMPRHVADWREERHGVPSFACRRASDSSARWASPHAAKTDTSDDVVTLRPVSMVMTAQRSRRAPAASGVRFAETYRVLAIP